MEFHVTLVPLVDSSLTPRQLFQVTYVFFVVGPWLLGHGLQFCGRAPWTARFLQSGPLLLGGILLHNYGAGYALLLATPLVLVERLWTVAEIKELLEKLLLANDFYLDETTRLRWAEDAARLGSRLAEIQLELAQQLKQEMARQAAALQEAATPSVWNDLWTFFEIHPILTATVVGAAVGTAVVVGLLLYNHHILDTRLTDLQDVTAQTAKLRDLQILGEYVNILGRAVQRDLQKLAPTLRAELNDHLKPTIASVVQLSEDISLLDEEKNEIILRLNALETDFRNMEADLEGILGAFPQ